MLLMQLAHCSVEEQFLLQIPVLHGSCGDPGNWRQLPPFRVFLWILEDCKTSLTNVLTHGEGLQSCQFISPSLPYLGEHLSFIPVSINRLCFWFEKLYHITAAHLPAWWGGKGWVTVPLTPRCVQYQWGPPPVLRDDKGARANALPVPTLLALKSGEKKEEKVSQCV